MLVEIIEFLDIFRTLLKDNGPQTYKILFKQAFTNSVDSGIPSG